MIAVVAVLIAAAVAIGICGTGHCSATNTTRARADTILSFINSITRSGRILTYPSSTSSAEERAVHWLVEDDLGTTMNDKQSLRQRYVLGTLWFLQPEPTTGFGSANDYHAPTWTTNIDECQWSDVKCDVNGRVTSLDLAANNVRGKIPADLGLLADVNWLSLWGNQLSGTILSSLGALTALTYLFLINDNQLSRTIPSSLGHLTALDGLSLHNNQLVGAMSFCNSDHSTFYLVADCTEVNCTCCCTECCPAAFGNILTYDYCG
jgi:hypothetical protein